MEHLNLDSDRKTLTIESSNQVKHTYEDFDGLINSLLTIDTFLLGFTLTYGNSISYDDLLEADIRYSTIWTDSNVNDWFVVPQGYTVLFSVTLVNRVQYSVLFLSLSLLFAIGSILGI